jgi:hypothetical protein
MEPQAETVQAGPTPDIEYYIKVMRGYSEEVEVHGSMGHSELGIHTRKADVPAVKAFCRPGDYNYAYVLLEDGTWIDGCFHRFADGTFSLS